MKLTDQELQDVITALETGEKDCRPFFQSRNNLDNALRRLAMVFFERASMAKTTAAEREAYCQTSACLLTAADGLKR